MRRTLFVLIILAFCGLAGVSSALAQEAAEKSAGEPTPPDSADIIVDYDGRLQDDNGQPISGIFHLAFKLYDGRHAAKPTWQARQFVAVVDGDYSVSLGTTRPLERAALPKDAWIGVEWVGQGELLRDQFQLGDQPAHGDAANKAGNAQNSGKNLTVSDETRKLLEAASKGQRITFADVAERAVSADTATTAVSAERLGNMSAEELKRTTQLALDRLGEHIADPDAHAATGGLGLGDRNAVQRRVGGDGGDPYQVNCPPGFVVTGIKGGAGKMLDSISIICTQLR